MKIGAGIPVYNGVEFLDRAIESVINQTRKLDLLVIYDDGSTDGTAEMLKKYDFQGIEHLIFSGEKNNGIGYARKFIVDELLQMGCDVIGFCSADDEWEPQFLEIMEGFVKEYPEQVIYCVTNLINTEGNSVFQSVVLDFESQGKFVYECWKAARKYKMFVNFSGVLIPAEVFKKVQFDPKETMGEDFKFLLDCISIYKIHYQHVNLPLIKYRCHSKMTTRIRIKDIGENDERIMREIKSKMLSLGEKLKAY